MIRVKNDFCVNELTIRTSLTVKNKTRTEKRRRFVKGKWSRKGNSNLRENVKTACSCCVSPQVAPKRKKVEFPSVDQVDRCNMSRISSGFFR